MKPITRILLISLLATSCSDDETTSGFAELNGEPFMASSVAAVISGNSLYIELVSGSSYLRFWVPRLKNGESPVNNTRIGSICEPSLAENTGVFAEYIDESGNVHFSVSGSLSLSITAGLVSGSFSFYAESMDDSEVTVTKGSFQSPISKPSGCLLTESGRLNEDDARTVYYAYNQHGNLVGLSRTIGGELINHYISYVNNKPVALASRGGWCSKLTLLTYAGDRVAATANTGEYTFEYNNQLLERYTYFWDQTTTLVYDENNNLVGSTLEAPFGTTSASFGNYDDHPNPATLMVQALQQQQALLVLLTTNFYFIPNTGSTNNPRQSGTVITVEYEYSRAGYPTKMVFKNSGGVQIGAPIFFTYTGCR
ncbi:MAG: hypothetical protein HRU69_09095 [Flammeovirgaceae bacterium]|nr:MAG: hypothetical protein HRU69_09095 [Flammeovirgaceae bacterium]